MSKRGRLALAVIVGLMMLWIGWVDVGDPTPAWIRWPLGVAASVGVALVAWWASGRR